MNFLKLLATAGVITLGLNVSNVAADVLDDVLNNGKLRCAVVLDFPPMGYRDADNNPAGMDVDICKDIAKRMEVEAEVVGVTWAERIPALVSGKVDVAIASSSDTLERAQTVGFTIPYMVFQYQVLLPKDSEVKTWEDLKDKNIGAAVGTTYETLFNDFQEKNWKDRNGSFQTFQSENESFLAVKQGRVDATIASDTSISNITSTEQFKDLKAGPVAPFGADIVGFMTQRKEYGWINYLNLYINRAYRDGTMQELYSKHIGGEMPDLTTDRVYY